jgi:hypothetical protein
VSVKHVTMKPGARQTPIAKSNGKPIKRITDHTPEELEDAINKAIELWGDVFWIMLHAIDAYQERRARTERTLKAQAELAYRRQLASLLQKAADILKP